MSPDDERSPADVDYIKAVMQVAGDDVRQVYLKVTGALAVPTLVLTQLPFSKLLHMPVWTRVVLLIGIGTARLAAIAYFRYLSKMHLARLEMAKHLKSGSSEEVSALWTGSGTFWEDNRRLIEGGTVCFVLSGVAFSLVLVQLLGLLE